MNIDRISALALPFLIILLLLLISPMSSRETSSLTKISSADQTAIVTRADRCQAFFWADHETCVNGCWNQYNSAYDHCAGNPDCSDGAPSDLGSWLNSCLNDCNTDLVDWTNLCRRL